MAAGRQAIACTLALLCAIAAGCTSLDLAGGVPEPKAGMSLESKLAFARLCERRHDYEQAKAVYRQVLAVEPDNLTACHRLGVVAAREGRLDAALDQLKHAASLAPPSAELHNDLGYAYYLHDELQPAEDNLRQALKISSGYEAAWTNLGLVLAEQHRDDEALAAFRHAGTEAEAQTSLAYSYARQGDFEKAQDGYRQALAQDPDMQHAGEGLLQVSSRLPGREPRLVFASRPKHSTSKPENQDQAAAAPDSVADLPASWNPSQRPVGPANAAAPASPQGLNSSSTATTSDAGGRTSSGTPTPGPSLSPGSSD